MLSYLESLTLRLAQAAAELPEDQRRRHGDFLLRAQQADGGFAGREGGSDLYYTGFALRGLAILGRLDDDVAGRTADFLKSRMSREESIIDFFSLIYGAKLIEAATGNDLFAESQSGWADSISDALGALRRDDGGYAKGVSGRASSTYHSFLVVLCLQLIERPVHDPVGLARFIRSQECEDGGFREIRVSKRAGTNPTAAAIGTLKVLDNMDDDLREGTLDFLAEMQMNDGGLRANTRIPIADALSTFTGLLTLLDLDGGDEIDLAAARDYLAGLEQMSGGFFGAEWDEVCDVEYTFYGLAGTALLNAELT